MQQSLTAYRIFYATANAGNISKAAKELFISQPAISKAVQKLEDALGCRLFTRSSRGVTLTEEGKLLYAHVKQAFETLSLGEEKLQRSKELGAGHLKIGASSALCKYLLLPYLKEFIKNFPNMNISIVCQSSNKTIRLLEEQKIDVGLVGKPKSQKQTSFEFFEEIEDIFVISPECLKYPKLQESGNKQLLENATLMLLDKQNMTRQYIDDYLQLNRIAVQESIDVSDMELLIEFAKIGLGAACVIRGFVWEELKNGSLIELPLETPIPKREVGFIYPKNESRTKSAELFARFLREKRRA